MWKAEDWKGMLLTIIRLLCYCKIILRTELNYDGYKFDTTDSCIKSLEIFVEDNL